MNYRFPLKQNRSTTISFPILTTAFHQKVAKNLSDIPQVSDLQAAVETKTQKLGALIMALHPQNHRRKKNPLSRSIPVLAKETLLQ